MKADLIRAKEIFSSGGYTCVLCRGEKIYTSRERGVKPLIMWIESDVDLKGFSAADKIVGKGAAMLYKILGVTEVYSEVMSESAVEVCTQYDIECHSGEIVKEIRNRQNTGNCPMENAVRDINTPQKAYEAIKQTMLRLAGINK